MTLLACMIWLGISVLFIVLLAVVRDLFECPHENTNWPQRGVQKCNHCGAERFYTIGQKPGPWFHRKYTAQKEKAQ